jgi:hypothetical protein
MKMRNAAAAHRMNLFDGSHLLSDHYCYESFQYQFQRQTGQVFRSLGTQGDREDE